MTNKEAIEVLSVIRRTPSVDIFNTLPNTADSCIEFDYRSAFDLAIKALERDGTIAFEDDEPTVCTCPVCGSIWKKVETDKKE